MNQFQKFVEQKSRNLNKITPKQKEFLLRESDLEKEKINHLSKEKAKEIIEEIIWENEVAFMETCVNQLDFWG